MAPRKRNIENVKKKQFNYIEFLKSLTKWITNYRRTDEQLDELITKYDIDNSIVKRIISYSYSFPYIIYYFNRYFNNLFDFSSFDTKTLLKSIVYLMEINNRCNSKNFMYIKSNELKDEIKKVIKDLIGDYMLITYNMFCSRQDLAFYYKLFKLGIIKDEDLLLIDRILNGENTVIKSLNFINYEEALGVSDPIDVLQEQQGESIRELSDKIKTFINSLKRDKGTLESCKLCPLYEKPIVVLDTNCDDIGDVDIAFIGLNPGNDEVKQDRPFVGDSGKYIRKLIYSLPSDKKWVIFNIILCNTSNKDEIKNIETVATNCSAITTKLFQGFPAKTYIPIGSDATSVFGIKDKITTASGKRYDLSNGVVILPLIHPSSVLRNSKNQSIYDNSVKNILKHFNAEENTNVLKKTNFDQTKTTNKNIITDDKDLLLVSIKRIENNQILMIYTDHAGNKKYIIRDFKLPVMIKNKEWNDCNMVTDKVDQIIHVNDYQKSLINKKCHQILNEITTL